MYGQYPFFGPPMPMYPPEPPPRRRWRGNRDKQRTGISDLEEAIAFRDSIDEFIDKELKAKKAKEEAIKSKDKPKEKKPYEFSALEWVLLLTILSPWIAKLQKMALASVL